MPRKYLEKRDFEQGQEDPLNPGFRRFFFKDDTMDTREHSEKVKDQFVQAGKDTRNANQLVKFVNAHLQGKVAQVEKMKEAQKKFDEELNMFRSSEPEQEQIKQMEKTPTNPEVQKALIVRELAGMINKYGIDGLSEALDEIIASQRQ